METNDLSIVCQLLFCWINKVCCLYYGKKQRSWDKTTIFYSLHVALHIETIDCALQRWFWRKDSLKPKAEWDCSTKTIKLKHIAVHSSFNGRHDIF